MFVFSDAGKNPWFQRTGFSTKVHKATLFLGSNEGVSNLEHPKNAILAEIQSFEVSMNTAGSRALWHVWPSPSFEPQFFNSLISTNNWAILVLSFLRHSSSSRPSLKTKSNKITQLLAEISDLKNGGLNFVSAEPVMSHRNGTVTYAMTTRSALTSCQISHM